MSGHADRAAAWLYHGLWGILTSWFKVPAEPPALPLHAAGPAPESFRPSPNFLRYLKFQFWFFLFAMDIGILAGWVALTIAAPIVGAILALPMLALAVVPDIFAYIALHLRYDSTWYVLSDRAMRIRRGIWTIHETTITFENVQNVTVRQGPIQRHFGIADLVVQTAGGGASHGKDKKHTPSHVGLLEGLADAPRIRDLILAKVRRSRGAGLGDEHPEHAPAVRGNWTPEHVAVLREIKELVSARPG